MGEVREKAADGSAGPAMPDGVEPPDGADPSAALQNLQAENETLKERNLLLLAEMAACRQRLDRDKEEFKKYAISEFAGDVLCVADNIHRAIEALPKELLGAVPALKSFTGGVEATERLLLQVLNRYRVTRYDPLGEAFNPHFHDAKAMVNIPDVPANTVVHVICAGYMIGDRVLRPAEVAVARGGDAVSQPQKPASPVTHPRPGMPGAARLPQPCSSGWLRKRKPVTGTLRTARRKCAANRGYFTSRSFPPAMAFPRPRIQFGNGL